MSTLNVFLLSAHVMLGLLGVILFGAAHMNLMKQNPKPSFVRKNTIWGAIFFILSWFTGGYYYAIYYGKSVKPVIIGGAYPWAHTVFTETKEHIFLFIPFLAIVVAAVLHIYADSLATKPELKKQISMLTGLVVVLGIIITLFGAVISGGVR